MQKRQLGNTDMEFTAIGLGTWAIGGSWTFGWGQQDESDAIKAILEAIDQGINWIDTAAIYGQGSSEKIVGKAVRQSRHELFIATKCGIIWDEKNDRIPCMKPKSIEQECHDSLKRLGVDVVDLYQIHWPNPEDSLEHAWEMMVKLKERQMVRYIGVSNFSVEQLEIISRIHPVASLQPPYSMLRYGIEETILPYCAKNNIGVITYSPMQKGLLTGKFNNDFLKTLDPEDHRLRDPNFQEPRFSATLELVEGLRRIADRNSITPAQLAIAWVLRREEVTAAIVGARKPGQIIETAKAADVTLSDDDLSEIEELLKIREEKIKQ
ncbi:MAG: aldo/keto reductase [Phycisphaerae bacterium]|nr:aldo/keto reductase [Phycisphaerae bacterium]